MNNIFEKHINATQKRLKKYMSLILKSRYDKNISEELIQTYIDARYYNYGVDNSIRIFYRRIYDAVKKKSEKLMKKTPRSTDQILDHLSLFQYYFYFDNVRYNMELDDVVDAIAEKRVTKFNIKASDDDNFKQEFLDLIIKDLEQVDDFLDMHYSEDFDLDIRKINSKNPNYYRVKLKYFFEFPEIYSKEIVEEVFNSDITSEDKLFVEYPMAAVVALKDVIVGNFNKMYVCDFAPELLNKKKKLDQLLGILENQAAQDKILFEIEYDDFVRNKEKLFEVIRKGFRFCVKTNDDMPKLSKEEIKMLEIFDRIIVSTKDVNKKQYKKTKILEG